MTRPTAFRGVRQVYMAEPMETWQRLAIWDALHKWEGHLPHVWFAEVDADGADAWQFNFAPIDGPRGKLAQAYYPSVQGEAWGDCTFDIAEEWDPEKLYLVALHEIGHLMGLRHTSAWSPRWELMYPHFSRDQMITAGTLREVNRWGWYEASLRFRDAGGGGRAR